VRKSFEVQYTMADDQYLRLRSKNLRTPQRPGREAGGRGMARREREHRGQLTRANAWLLLLDGGHLRETSDKILLRFAAIDFGMHRTQRRR